MYIYIEPYFKTFPFFQIDHVMVPRLEMSKSFFLYIYYRLSSENYKFEINYFLSTDSQLKNTWNGPLSCFKSIYLKRFYNYTIYTMSAKNWIKCSCDLEPDCSLLIFIFVIKITYLENILLSTHSFIIVYSVI